MKSINQSVVSILAVLAVSASADDLKQSLELQSGSVIFYGGDSIESTNLYSHYLQAWFYLSYPELNLKIYHYGRSGSSLAGWAASLADTASGAAQGLCERYMYPFDPAVFILKMGGNGGQTADQHKATYEYLITNWIDTAPGRKLVMLGQWSSQSMTDNYNMRGKGDKEAEIASTDPDYFSADVYDILGPVWIANFDNAIDIQQPGVNPALSGGTRDSIHCGPAGHFVTAWATLQAMGAESLVSRATINATSSSTTVATNCSISNLSLSPNGGTFKRLDTRLPWAYDVNGRVNGNLLASRYNLGDGTLQDWQDYSLTVTGLAEGTYEVKCDGVAIGSASNVQLAAGWNMAGLEVGPVFDQVQEVLGRIRDLENMNRVTGADLGNPNAGTMADFVDYSLGYYQQQKHRGSLYFNEMQPLVTAMDQKIAAIHNAARPLTRSYAITRTSTNASGGGSTPAVPPGRAWNYVGVPYPDWEYDPFTHPAPAVPPEWPAAAKPGYYHIAPDVAGATDTPSGGEPVDANGYRWGYPAKPRKTWPVVGVNTNTFPAGTILWIKGGTWNYTTGTISQCKASFLGTPSAPCWIYGDPDDKPVLTTVNVWPYASTYLFVENLIWGYAPTSGGGFNINANDKNGQSHHITVRNCHVQDRHYFNNSAFFALVGPALGTGGIDAEIHDIVFYRNQFKNNGGGVNWNYKDADLHGYKFDGAWGVNRVHKIWVIGDTVATGDTPPDPLIPYAQRPAEDVGLTEDQWATSPHNGDGLLKSIAGSYIQVGDQNVQSGNTDHIYIAGNVVKGGVRQMGVDGKRCANLVVSSNTFKDFIGSATAQGQAFGVKYDRQDNLWFVNNYVENCNSFFIRAETTSGGAGGADTFSPGDTSVYVIGNIFKDCLQGRWNIPDKAGIGGWKTKGIAIQDMNGKVFICNNVVDTSVYGVYFAALGGRQSAGSEMHVYNNIAVNLSAGLDTSTAANNGIMVSTATTTKWYMENNLVENGRFYYNGIQYSSATAFNTRADATGNLNGNPLFGDPGNGDYTLSSGSPAIGAGVVNSTIRPVSVYSLFLSAFSSDSDFPGSPADVWPRDFAGNSRFRNGTIDLGAYQYGSPPVMPIGDGGGDSVSPPSRPKGLKAVPRLK